jgi:hypothetical protein
MEKKYNLGRLFNSRSERATAYHSVLLVTKQPDLKLETRTKQILGSLLLAYALANLTIYTLTSCRIDKGDITKQKGTHRLDESQIFFVKNMLRFQDFIFRNEFFVEEKIWYWNFSWGTAKYDH